MADQLNFLKGTQSAYDKIDNKDSNTFYHTIDTNLLYLGENPLNDVKTLIITATKSYNGDTISHSSAEIQEAYEANMPMFCDYASGNLGGYRYRLPFLSKDSSNNWVFCGVSFGVLIDVRLTPQNTILEQYTALTSSSDLTSYELDALPNKTNGNVTLNLNRSGATSTSDNISIKGTGTTTVTTDANGVITINSTAHPTIPSISIGNKTNSDTEDLVYAITDLVEGGTKGHTITPTYTGLPTKSYVDKMVTGTVEYKGTVTALTGLSTSAGAGDFYRVSTAFTFGSEIAHVGDILIATKDNPAQNTTDWDLIHTEVDSNTWTANSKSAAGYVAAGGSNASKVWKTDASGNPSWRDDADTNTTYDLSATASASNGNVKINLTAGGSGSGTDSITIAGSGATTVTSDANGAITINSSDTDTKVTQTVTTANASYPLLLAPSEQTTTKTTTSYFDSGVTLNPSTNTIAANISGTADKAKNDISGNAIQRTYTSMIPYGTVIPSGANLNVTDYLRVGNYYNSKNAEVATMTNCPTTLAFMMQVYSPLSTAIDNETSKTWVYRLRKIIDHKGNEYYQFVNSGATAGSFTYGEWTQILKTTALSDSVTSESSKTIATSKAVKIAYDRANEAYTLAEGADNLAEAAQTRADNAYTLAESKADSLSDLGITATATELNKLDGITTTTTELNYVKGVTSNIQTQLNSKANLSEGAIFIEGSGTTDSTAKTSTWIGTSDRITSYYDGLTIRYKIGVAGQSTTTLNINNLGAKTVYRFSTSKLTTHFPVGSIIHLIYHTDLNDGCWMCSDYDANTNTQMRVYRQTTGYNADYPLLVSRTKAADIATKDSNGSYEAIYGVMWNDTTKVPTLNPSTGEMKAVKFTGVFNGNATSATSATKATQDASGNTITSTYETKTEASSKLAEANTYTDNAVAQKTQVQFITWEADD